jgi:ABC-type transport system involved in multi-copper enzyme maturation permease subunit
LKNHASHTWTVGKAIGWVTFLEVIREKILYNVVLCVFFLFFMGFLASQLNFLHPERLVLDFGLLTVSLSSSFIAILIGSSVLLKEFERRTVYVALSHPISKAQFVLGKFMGLVMVLTSNWLLQSFCYLILLSLSSETLFGAYSWALFWALLFVMLQSLVLTSIAILFSTFSTTALSVIFTIGFFFIGNSISQLRLLGTRLQSSIGSTIVNGVASLLPNLEHFSLGNKVTYGLPVSWQFVTLGIFYGLFVIALCLVLAGLLIQRREV